MAYKNPMIEGRIPRDLNVWLIFYLRATAGWRVLFAMAAAKWNKGTPGALL